MLLVFAVVCVSIWRYNKELGIGFEPEKVEMSHAKPSFFIEAHTRIKKVGRRQTNWRKSSNALNATVKKTTKE